MPEFRDPASEWTDEYYPAPANFDRAGFQRQLDEICGTARGQSIVRVVWGAEEETEVAEQITGLGKATKMVKIGRHRTRVSGKAGKVRKRRWIFEQWQPPEQIEGEGFVQMPGAAGLYLPQEFAQEQLKGKWTEIYIVADHSKCQPDVCNSLEYFCFGDYREPDASDLNKFRRINARKAQVDHADPFAPLGQNKVNLYNKQAQEEVERVDAEQDAVIKEFHADVEKTLAKVSTSGKGA